MAWIQTVSSPALFRNVRKHWSNFGYSNAGLPRVFRPGLRAETRAAARLRRNTLEHAQPGQITSKSVGAKARSPGRWSPRLQTARGTKQISASWYAARAGLKHPPEAVAPATQCISASDSSDAKAPGPSKATNRAKPWAKKGVKTIISHPSSSNKPRRRSCGSGVFLFGNRAATR